MADVAAAPVLSPTTPVTAVRPTKPDEALFRETLAKAEKEHADAMSQFVRHLSIPSIPMPALPLREDAPQLEPTPDESPGVRDLDSSCS